MMKALLLVLTLLCIPLPASANLLFDWTGTCLTGCTGQATFHVVTIDTFPIGVHTGPPGQPWLVEAHYQDSAFNVLGFSGTFWNRNGIDLLLPASGPGPSVINAEQFGFTSDASGNWRVSTDLLGLQCPVGIFCNHLATGIGSVWAVDAAAAAVPWPATGLLVLVGLPALRRRCAPRF